MIKIRSAVVEDINNLLDSIIQSFANVIFETGEEPPGYTDREKLQKHIVEKHCYIAENSYNNEIVGFYIFYPKVEGIFYLSRIGVIPSWQGAGIGKSLIVHMLQSISDAKVWELHTVANDKRTSQFYENFGFKKVGEEKPKNVVLSIYRKEMKE